jgi:ribonuclease HII
MATKRKTVSRKLNQVDLPPFEWKRLTPAPLVGIDEVGRGCLAGPVFSAAVILPEDFSVEGITDSKLLSESRREELSELIQAQASVGIGFASVGEVDRLNILHATFLAMRRAVENLGITHGHLLIDGNQRIPSLDGFLQTTVIKGDLRAQPIGAASIVAKVARDTLMKGLGERYPAYGFEKHKGYGSPSHLAAIQRFGPCVHHRSTFAGVREHWNEALDQERALDPF